MNKNNLCPECKNSLSEKAKRCVCGWFLSEKKEPSKPDYRCQYTINGIRCQNPGGTCPYPYRNGPWYCSEHARASDGKQS